MSPAARRLPLLATTLAMALPLAPRPGLAHAAQLLRYPYLTDVVGGFATLNWGTDRSFATGYATYGNADTESGAAPVLDGTTRVFHFLLVTVQGTPVTVTPTDELGRTFDVRTHDF
jgi:hypothetical protein